MDMHLQNGHRPSEYSKFSCKNCVLKFVVDLNIRKKSQGANGSEKLNIPNFNC